MNLDTGGDSLLVQMKTMAAIRTMIAIGLPVTIATTWAVADRAVICTQGVRIGLDHVGATFRAVAEEEDAMKLSPKDQ